MSRRGSHGLTFNLVFVGDSFLDFHLFTTSVLEHCDESIRLVANGCTADARHAMAAWAADRAERVVEVLDVSPVTVSHGAALDRTLAQRDDGDHFAFLDTDIKARGPFVAELLAVLDTGVDAVTAGRSVFTPLGGVPAAGPWVIGDNFYDEHGFELGSAHAAIYRRAPLVATTDRWAVGFGSSGVDSGVEGGELPTPAAEHLLATGHPHTTYDSVKVLNILFQEDGNKLRHVDVANLLHIGGLSTDRSEPTHFGPYLERLRADLRKAGDPGSFARTFPEAMRRRRGHVHLGAVLRAVGAGEAIPPLPDGLDADEERLLVWLTEEIVGLAPPPPAPTEPPPAPVDPGGSRRWGRRSPRSGRR